MPAAPAPLSVRVIRELGWRLVASACGGMLLALTVAALLETRVSWLQEWDAAGMVVRYKGRMFWFHWKHVWLTGGAIGLLLPNLRLPTWLTHIALGGLLSISLGCFCAGLIDSFLAATAVNRAYAPFAEVQFPDNCVDCHPPLPYQKFYPSVYRSLFWRGVLGGFGVGALLGAAWHTTATRRWLFAVTAALISVGFFWESWNFAAQELDGYVIDRQQYLHQQAAHR